MIQTDLYSFSYKKGTVVPWCKRCGTQNFYKAGKNKEGKQKYKCKNCGYRFVWTSDFPKRHFFSNVILFATELYGSVGISLRTIAKKFRKFFGIKVSHEGIRKWILAAKKLHVIDEEFVATKTWHVDETWIRIKEIGFWLWVVYCKESKHVIAWHISREHTNEDAKILFRKALAKSQGRRPKLIITDGLWQYPHAIYKTMRWSWREQRKRHLVDSGVGKNALIERVNKEIKRRYKWFGSLQAMDGAQAFFSLFFYHFNQNGVNSQELT